MDKATKSPLDEMCDEFAEEFGLPAIDDIKAMSPDDAMKAINRTKAITDGLSSTPAISTTKH